MLHSPLRVVVFFTSLSLCGFGAMFFWYVCKHAYAETCPFLPKKPPEPWD